MVDLEFGLQYVVQIVLDFWPWDRFQSREMVAAGVDRQDLATILDPFRDELVAAIENSLGGSPKGG